MTKRDYYEVLGVTRSAAGDEIKRAYRKLAKKHHPDRNQGSSVAAGKFKEVQEAYQVLSDHRQRALYDQFGHDAAAGQWATSGATGYRRATGPAGQAVDINDFQDLFSTFGGSSGFGGPAGGGSVFDQIFGRNAGPGRPRRRRPPATPGQDLEHEVRLTFDQAVHGTTLQLELDRSGTGQATAQTISVRIPPGVEDSQRIRIREQGQAGTNGAPPGHLYIRCRVGAHPYFRRDGADTYVHVPLTLAEAALGAAIEVPTVDGMATVRVPAGTPSGRRLRLRGRGIRKNRGDGRGDHYAVIQIVPPAELTPAQRELFEKLAETALDDPRATAPWASAATPGEA